jgi:type VI secretion system protein ImpK
MIKDMPYDQDDKTVLLDRLGRGPTHGPLTDSAAPPRFEQLEDRMIYAARQASQETFNVSRNSLVASASWLLSEVVRLKHCATGEDLPHLNQRLSAALEHFAVSASRAGVESSQVSTARYVLCTVVDEAVVMTAWGKESEWSQMSLLSRFHNETSGGEKFFQLLDRLSKNPIKHRSMLELMYLCLSLGFEGKYRIQARGLLELENLRDALFRQIRLLRTDVPTELSPRDTGHAEGKRQSLVRTVPWWMMTLITVMCLMVMYSGFAWVLSEQRAVVLHPLQQFDQPAIHLQVQPWKGRE